MLGSRLPHLRTIWNSWPGENGALSQIFNKYLDVRRCYEVASALRYLARAHRLLHVLPDGCAAARRHNMEPSWLKRLKRTSGLPTSPTMSLSQTS